MSKYLVSTTEIYRVDNENEVKEIIETAKNSTEFSLAKYSSEFKERKSKGEVIDSWFRVTLNKHFNDEKDPTNDVTIAYGVN